MRKILNLIFAMAMILSIVFIGDLASSNNPFAAQAQTKVSVRKKNNGLYGKSKSGVKYLYRKGKNGTVYVYRKSKQGVVYVGRKSYQGGKYVGGKTVKGSKWIWRKGKKIVVGQ